MFLDPPALWYVSYPASSLPIPSLGPQDPQPQARHQPPHHPEFFFALPPQGPAGKDGEAGAQGAPGPAVSVPAGRPGRGAGEQQRGDPRPLLSWAFLTTFSPDRALLVREVNKALLAPPDSR